MQLNYAMASFNVIRVVTRDLSTVSNPKADPSAVYRVKIPYDDNFHHKKFSISFDFQNFSPSGGNLFQTDSEGSGLRVEQIVEERDGKPMSRILLQYRSWNEERLLESTRQYDPLRKNRFDLQLNFQNHLTVRINNVKFIDTQIDKQDIRYRDFVLGAGLSASRVFSGTISNTRFTLEEAIRDTPVPIWAFAFSITGGCFWFAFRTSRLRTLGQISGFVITCTLIIALNSEVRFAEFFGDDFLNIWPVRRSDVFTIFSEALGPYYRPLTQLLFLVRWDLHGYEILQWKYGSQFLLLVVVALHFALYFRTLNLSTGHASLLCLLTFTSPIYFGGAFWWASNGSQHLLSIGLTASLAISLVRVLDQKSASSDLRYPLFYLFLLSLTSELFMPLFFALPVLILLYELTLTSSAEVGHIDKGEPYHSGSSMQAAKVRKFNLSSILTFVSLGSILIGVRYLIVQVPTAVAATSAVNYRFDTFSSASLSNPIQYGLSFFNIFISENVFDIAAGNGHMLKLDEIGLVAKMFVVVGFTMSLVLGTMTLSTINKVQKVRCEVTTKWSDVSVGSLFGLLAVFSIAAPSLVPSYLQLRWIQFGYLFGIVGFSFLLKAGKRANRRLAVATAIVLTLSNVLALRANFGILS